MGYICDGRNNDNSVGVVVVCYSSMNGMMMMMSGSSIGGGSGGAVFFGREKLHYLLCGCFSCSPGSILQRQTPQTKMITQVVHFARFLRVDP